jgi:hypothetical protein
MNERHPPKLATWLLTHLCNGSRDDSLIGDLHEQFATGRSSGWYWRQSLVALAQSTRRAMRLHTLSFVGAIAASWTVLFAWFALNMTMTAYHASVLRFVHGTFAVANGHQAWMVIYWLAAGSRVILFAIAGWLAVRIHRAHPYAVAVALLASAWMVRWVPWRTYRAFDTDTLALIHDVTAIGGLLLGAAWAIHKEKRRALADAASLSG